MSARMALAILALFVSLAGTSYAAITVTGKTVKNGSLTAKDVKRNSLSGAQIAESKLKTVPNARTAAAANGLAGPAAAAYLASAKALSTGVIRLPRVGTSPATSPVRELGRRGPFTIGAACYDSAGKTTLRLSLKSTERRSVLAGDETTVSEFDYESSDVFAFEPSIFTMQAPSGATLAVTTAGGVNGLGSPCFISADALAGP